MIDDSDPELKSIMRHFAEKNVHQKYDDIDDSDVAFHESLINPFFSQMKESLLRHVLKVKDSMLTEKSYALNDFEQEARVQIRELLCTIRSLKEKLLRSENESNDRFHQMAAFEIMQSKVISLLQKKANSYSVKSLLSLIIHNWRLMTESKIRSRQTLSAFALGRKRYILQKYFLVMVKARYERKLQDAEKTFRQRLEACTRSIVEKYEVELHDLRGELAEARETIDAERVHRQQIEENLKRMFLRNMTSLNMEALSMFQQPPQPPQPTMYEYEVNAIITPSSEPPTSSPLLVDVPSGPAASTTPASTSTGDRLSGHIHVHRGQGPTGQSASSKQPVRRTTPGRTSDSNARVIIARTNRNPTSSTVPTVPSETGSLEHDVFPRHVVIPAPMPYNQRSSR